MIRIQTCNTAYAITATLIDDIVMLSVGFDGSPPIAVQVPWKFLWNCLFMPANGVKRHDVDNLEKVVHDSYYGVPSIELWLIPDNVDDANLVIVTWKDMRTALLEIKPTKSEVKND